MFLCVKIANRLRAPLAERLMSAVWCVRACVCACACACVCACGDSVKSPSKPWKPETRTLRHKLLTGHQTIERKIIRL